MPLQIFLLWNSSHPSAKFSCPLVLPLAQLQLCASFPNQHCIEQGQKLPHLCQPMSITVLVPVLYLHNVGSSRQVKIYSLISTNANLWCGNQDVCLDSREHWHAMKHFQWQVCTSGHAKSSTNTFASDKAMLVSSPEPNVILNSFSFSKQVDSNAACKVSCRTFCPTKRRVAGLQVRPWLW